MKSFEEPIASLPEEGRDISAPESRLFSLGGTTRSEREILSSFTPEQVAEIQRRQKLLSSLAYFVGKDFDIPVLLNPPGGGWFWDFERNEIKIDAQDLLEKPIDYLRFVICHEAGHRRISRVKGVVPDEVWQSPGFPFMMNAIEDCRDNNFVAETYPRFKDQAIFSYDLIEEERKAKERAGEQLGIVPKSMQAGFEYMKQWLRDVKGESFDIPKDLSDDVKEVVTKTLKAAEDFWWRYPSKEEADESEETITAYAKRSFNIAYEKIWPEYKKLVEEDIKNQEMQEALKGQQGQGKEGNGMPNLKDKLTPQEQQELEEVIEKAIEAAKRQEGEKVGEDTHGKPEENSDSEKGKAGSVIDLDSLSPELKQKIREYIESLPEELKQEIRKSAEEALKKFEKEIADALEGKLIEEDSDPKTEKKEEGEEAKLERPDTSELRKTIEEIMNKDKNAYEKARQEVLPIIQSLENDLRDIFTRRRASNWETGFKSGKKIDIKRRIQEKAKGITAVESRAWEKRERPQEKDYAITLLVDLSGSMRGEKIQETFKAVVALAEVLSRLSINLEILGFHDEMREYQKFGRNLSKESREEMGTILKEVDTSHAQYNDDGWALEEASKRLERERAVEKFLIVLSDGIPEPSSKHGGSKYELGKIVKKVREETDQKLIGLGIGSGTEHVESYYPSSLIGVKVKEMSEKLADLIKEVVANYDQF